MTSRCSRSSQPNNAATIKCSGSTHGVYDKPAWMQFSDTTVATLQLRTWSSAAGPSQMIRVYETYELRRQIGSQVVDLIDLVSSQDAGDVPALAFARSRSYGVWPAKAPCGRW